MNNSAGHIQTPLDKQLEQLESAIGRLKQSFVVASSGILQVTPDANIAIKQSRICLDTLEMLVQQLPPNNPVFQPNIQSLSQYPENATYLPLIPTSPLILSQQKQQETLGQAKQDLDLLQQKQSSSETHLGKIRGQVDKVNMLKSRISALDELISKSSLRGLLDFMPDEVAQQLMRFNAEMFTFITPADVQSVAMGIDPSLFILPNPNTATLVPHSIRSILDFSFYISRIVQMTILFKTDTVTRSRAIDWWIVTAMSCFAAHDFQAVKAILDGLTAPPVARLHFSWSTQKSLQTFNDLQVLMNPDDDFKTYRNQLERTTTPIMPYLYPHLVEMSRTRSSYPTWERFKGGSLGMVAQTGSNHAALAVGHVIVSQLWLKIDHLMRLSFEAEEPPHLASMPRPMPAVPPPKQNVVSNLVDSISSQFAQTPPSDGPSDRIRPVSKQPTKESITAPTENPFEDEGVGSSQPNNQTGDTDDFSQIMARIKKLQPRN